MIYLSHPFDSRERFRKWQLDLEKKGLKFINPFYNNESVEVFDDSDQNNKEYYKKIRLLTDSIVRHDIKFIGASEALVCMITGQTSYGTIQEMVYGKLFHKKVYTLVENDQEDHPWIKYHSDKVFTELGDLEKFLLKGVIRPVRA